MSFQKISVFVTAILALAVIVLAFIAYAQLSETRQMREDMASLRHATEAENQVFRDELASIRAEMTKLDSSEDLAAIQKSISRLRLQTLGLYVEDKQIVSLREPQSSYPTWWRQYPDTVRTITHGDYGAVWPFEIDEAILGCHGGEVMVVVEGYDFMVDSTSPSLHGFLTDMSEFSVFDPASPELAIARERMFAEAQGLCHGKVVQ